MSLGESALLLLLFAVYELFIWKQLVADAPPPLVPFAGGEASRELACDGESQALLEAADVGGNSGYDAAREMDLLEAAVVNGRRAQVHAPLPPPLIRPPHFCDELRALANLRLTHAAVVWPAQVVAAAVVLGRPQSQFFPREHHRSALQLTLARQQPHLQQVLLMLLFVFVMVAALSSVFLSLTIVFACAASVPPRTMAFTLLAIGAEAPDCIVNFIASK